MAYALYFSRRLTPLLSLQPRRSCQIRRRGHFLNENVKQPINDKLNADLDPLRLPKCLPALKIKLDYDDFPPPNQQLSKGLPALKAFARR